MEYTLVRTKVDALAAAWLDEDVPGLDYAGAVMPGPQFWAVTFFLMLWTLGLDSSFAWIETLNTYLDDALKYRGIVVRKELICLATCGVHWLVGLWFCTRGGFFWFTLTDHYAATYILLIVGFFELMLVSWIYGAERLARDLEEMTGKRLSRYWIINWKWINPILVLSLALFTMISDIALPHHAETEPPGWAQFLGWLTVIIPVSAFPVMMFKTWYDDKKNPPGNMPPEQQGSVFPPPAENNTSLQHHSDHEQAQAHMGEDGDDNDDDDDDGAIITHDATPAAGHGTDVDSNAPPPRPKEAFQEEKDGE